MAPDPLALQIAANRRAAGAVRFRVLAFITTAWWGLGSWNVPDIDRFVALVLPAVLAGQRTIASLTDQYLILVAESHGYQLRPSVDLEQVTGTQLRGVDPELVYRRGGAVVWDALKAGEPLDVATQRGLDRTVSTVETDLQLAKTHTARAVMAADDRITGYRRVLEGAYSCGLCLLASTQRYHKADLLPIHPGCDCDVEPLFGADQHVIDEQTLALVHQRAAEYFGSDATRIASAGGHVDHRPLDFRDFVVVHDHGEYGPTLGRRGQTFEGPHI